MNDVKMMLGKRAAEYYLFITWCITVPVLVSVIVLSKLITARPLSNGAGGGFAAYVYPEWSNIAGWLIFALCIIPIPLVFIINYIREYMALGRGGTVSLVELDVLHVCICIFTKETTSQSRGFCQMAQTEVSAGDGRKQFAAI